ncbi:phospholipase D family protein [Microbulbifer sp. CAU 1566]|uniref:phospholipase D family protein n=1 Tax=Microbulbifer sp. CAU 1566 TaxID=2933269 RepID=UPI0020066BBD|nr:phospholipase D family protein [Microbulbifer sp. CAU 1566]MCK7597648.1 phospholipase D family protein [Microbulbifer sp. CAU 1566]
MIPVPATRLLNLALLVALLVALLSGCGDSSDTGTGMTAKQRTVTTSLKPAIDSRLAVGIHDALATQSASESGFYLLSDGLSAFVARAVLVEEATVSLDLKYYIYEDDSVGHLLTSLLLKAADRGVRVRLLVDDLGTRVVNPWILALDRHPNMQIRVFNPVEGRSGPKRVLEQALNLGRINHRMHNKLLVADGLAMITGGRNIADGYFSKSTVEFLDVDLLAIGEVLPQAGKIFDNYWNNQVSVPVSELLIANDETHTLDELRKRTRKLLAEEKGSEFSRALEQSRLAAELSDGDLPFQWGKARLLADPPEKALGEDNIPREEYPGFQLEEIIQSASERLNISAAYFIPGVIGTDLFTGLEKRGVNVGILTNSLSSNDVAIVHGAYARYRKRLLQAGVGLWELRTVAGQERRKKWFRGESRATLHAKTFVVDRNLGFVGSINLDGRSLLLNTEIGLLMENAEINQQLQDLFEDWVAADSAWAVKLSDANQLEWHAQDDEGNPLVMHKDPETTWWQRTLSWLLSWLPVESQI